MGSGGSSPLEERPVRQVNHSRLSCAEIKNVWSSTSATPYAFRTFTGANILLLYVINLFVTGSKIQWFSLSNGKITTDLACSSYLDYSYVKIFLYFS
jgi:hypothetical protein